MIVVIPSYKEEPDRVRQTVASALALPSVERVIVVDDGTPAPIWRVPQDLATGRCRVLYLPRNVGVAAALNEAIGGIEGDPLIARLEVGDTFTEHKEAMVHWMLEDRVVAAFSPHRNGVTGEDFRIAENWDKRIYTDNQFSAPTTVFRRSVWLTVGGYDPLLRWVNDWDFAIKVQAAVGWRWYLPVTTVCGEYPGGFTDQAHRNRHLTALREDELRRVRARALRISHPDHQRDRRYRGTARPRR